VNRLKAILQMHQGRWTNELTVGDCGYVYDRVLTEHERTVVNFKIEGFSNAEIAKFLGVKVATIRVLKIQNHEKISSQRRVAL